MRLVSNALIRGALALAIVSALSATAQAQQVTQPRNRPTLQPDTVIKRGVTHKDLVDRLRASGMTRADAAGRLREAGYDTMSVAEYFDALEGIAPLPRGEPSPAMIRIFDDLGVVYLGVEPVMTDSARAVRDSVEMRRRLARERTGSDIFGRAIFEAPLTDFDPGTGPVDPDYRLGPGDELIIALSGDVEATNTFRVSRDGTIVIRDVGPIVVAGLTMAQLEDVLFERLGRVFSGLSRSPYARTRFQASLGKLRSAQVFVMGEVMRPGAIQVSATSTVFDALYKAGGPVKTGSYRAIQVRRSGVLFREVDLYDYLLKGDNRNDVRLQHGDIVFVPIAGTQVRVEGAVKRPAIYEVKPAEGLKDLLNFAGGTAADALVTRVQIDRVLPPEQRVPGRDRVLLDADLTKLDGPNAENVALRPGDAINVFGVSEYRRNRVKLAGEVRRPGTYEWQPGLTLLDLINRADGLAEQAYTARAHVFRRNLVDATRSLIRVTMSRDSVGNIVSNMPLADADSVVIYSTPLLGTLQTVTIEGWVKNPGAYTLAEGMTVNDLILIAGGFREGALTHEVEVARLPQRLVRSDTTAHVFMVSLEDASSKGSSSALGVRDSVYTRGWVPSASELKLHAGDRVFIRREPGYETVRIVKISGEVNTPGEYVLRTRSERLSDVLARAGGMTAQAYAPGVQLVRDSTLVATDVQRALKDPGGIFDLLIEAGDSLHVPPYNATVEVTGAVAYEARVLYRPGKGLSYYVEQAGGYTHTADKRRVSVSYPDGSRNVVGSTLGIRSTPEVRPGSIVTVPHRPPEKEGNTDQLLTRSLSYITSILTLIIAYKQLD